MIMQNKIVYYLEDFIMQVKFINLLKKLEIMLQERVMVDVNQE